MPLLAKGFGVLARRWRSPVGEINIVARRGRLILLVEVKGRGELAAHPEHEGYDFRVDAILVTPGGMPEHVVSAFEVES